MSGAPEPDSVKELVARLTGQNNGGPENDKETVLKIYADWRWSLKKASMIGKVTYRDIDTMLDAVIKRLRKQVKDPAIRDQAVEKFTQAKNKLSEFLDDEALRAHMCSVHDLPFFICPCPKP